MNKIGLGLILAGTGFCMDAVGATKAQSVVTPIVGSSCTVQIDDEVTGATTSRCPGAAGFRLHVLADDERYSIDIVTPEKKGMALNYWEVVTHGFSSIGTNAEWRVVRVSGKTVPIALIVRLDTFDQSTLERRRRVPYLVVAQIRGDSACVIAKLDATKKTAASAARKIADGAKRPCLASDDQGNH